MVIRFHKKSIIHYFLIYSLIIINQSCLYEYFLRSDKARYLLFAIIVTILVIKWKSTYFKYLLFSFTLLIFVTITRFTAGGIGLSAWVWWSIPILLCPYVINYDRKKFLSRFTNTVFFLAAVGLLFFAIQIISIERLYKFMPFKYTTMFTSKLWHNSFEYDLIYHKGAGLFLYSVKLGGDSLLRNKGIFTEPGICQMLYNSAIFIILFFPEQLSLTKKQFRLYLFILIAAVISVQSTTGYFALIITLICYLISNPTQINKTKRTLISLIFAGLIFLIIDYYIRGTRSLWYIAIEQKIFASHGSIGLNGSGMSRVAAAAVSIHAMLKYPLGTGADKLEQLLAMNPKAGGGAGIFRFGAVSGIGPFVLCILFYIVPILKAHKNKITKFALLFMIFNTLVAQTSPFYPMLMIFPVYFMEERYQE